MLSFAIEHEKPLIEFIADPHNELRKYRLDQADFKLIKDLAKVLLVSYKSATSATPTPADKP